MHNNPADGASDSKDKKGLELIDSHCHFDFSAFDSDREQVWEQCQQLGTQRLLIPGVSPEQWAHARKLCQDNDGLVYAAGLHPWWLEKVTLDAQALSEAIRAELKQPSCHAIGECGLDALQDMPVEQQLPLLEVQLQLAAELQVPIIIHCVRAHNPMIRALKQHQFAAGGVIHAYSGSYEQAMQYWQMGFYLGVGGTITYERAKKTRDAVSRLPLDALLLESDAPDMPLEGHQGERNTPAAITDVAQMLADLRGEAVTRVAQQTSANARRLFRL